MKDLIGLSLPGRRYGLAVPPIMREGMAMTGSSHRQTFLSFTFPPLYAKKIP
jgi:hypothetical protein